MNLSTSMILVFLLSAGTSLAAVDVSWLTEIVNVIVTTVEQQGIKGQFAVAANIPERQEANTLQTVLNIDGTFKKTLWKGHVYQRSNVVAALTQGADHAEYSVLLALQPLMGNSNGHVLIIYSLKSPCLKCTGGNVNGDDQYSILRLIRDRVIRHWNDRVAFVFTTIYDNHMNADEVKENTIRSLENLGGAIGLANIFRCYEPGGSNFQCYSCLVRNSGEVSDVCSDKTFVPGQGGSGSQTRERSGSPGGGRGFIGPQRPGGSGSGGSFIGPQRPGGSGSQMRERSRSPGSGGSFIGPQRPGGSGSGGSFIGPQRPGGSGSGGSFIGPQRPGGSGSGGSFIGPQRPGGSGSGGSFIGPQRPGGSGSSGSFIGPQRPGGSGSQMRERSRSSSSGSSSSSSGGSFIGPKRPRYGRP